MFPIVEIRQPDEPPLFVSVRGPLDIGRECHGVLLSDPQVSRRHLRVDVDGERLVVSDLGSTNGTRLDGELLESPTVLVVGNVVTFGATSLRLVADSAVSLVEPDIASTTVMAPVPEEVADAHVDPVIPTMPPDATDDPWAPTELT